MPTIDRSGPFRVLIYLNDHEPAHVHIHHPSGEVIVNLATDDVELQEIRGPIKDNDVQRALKLAEDRKEYFRGRWREIHGGE